MALKRNICLGKQLFITYMEMLVISIFILSYLLFDDSSLIGVGVMGRGFLIGMASMVTVVVLVALFFEKKCCEYKTRRIFVNIALVLLMLFVAGFEGYQLIYTAITSGLDYTLVVDNFLVIVAIACAFRIADHIWFLWVMKEVERIENGN